MSLQVYISHNGNFLTYNDPNTRVDSLRSWIEANAGIPASRQILMTGRGKIVKNLSNEQEVYVYDKQFLSPGSKPPSRNDIELQTLSETPSSLADENSLKAWQDLFMTRRTWALEAFEIARTGVENIEICADEASVIARSMNIALDNLRNHVTTLQQRFEETNQWAQGYIQEHRDVLKDWQGSADTLAELPVREDVARVLRRSVGSDNTGATAPIGTLFDVIDRDALHNSAESVRQNSADFEKRLQELRSGMERLKHDTDAAQARSTQVPDYDTNALLEETETLAKRIMSDYEDVIQMQENQKSLIAASRKAATHTRELLPALQGVVAETVQASLGASEARNTASKEWYSTLQTISSIQSRLAELQSAITNLDFQDNDNFAALNRVFQLPLVYGATLVEATRRSEWTEKMRTEVDTLHEDLSQQTEEEQRRRKKWAASHNEFLNEDMNAKDALIDLKASAPRNSWPFVSRDEIFAWVDDLRALGIDDAVQSVMQRMKDLDAPVRKQKPKPFKNGSIHDLSQSAALRNGDEVRGLQDDKARLEEKLRASDSRVRKLEDLLHRQSQLSRPASGIFQPGSAADFERQTTPSPSALHRPSDLSRRSSVSNRRMSNNQDDKSLVQKIITLESQIQKLQDEAHAERRSSTESRDKMQEAELVKRDLMANFEAQKQEFEEERQLLDDEVHRLKVKLEEAEEELDRLNDSRDHFHKEQDQTVVNLRHELDQLKKTSAEDLAQADRRLQQAQKESVAQRERAASFERQLHQLKEERASAQSQNVALANQLRHMEDQQQDYVAILQGAHSNLSPAGSAPEDLKRLVNALEILSEGAAIHARGLDESLQLTTAENKSLEEKLANVEGQIKNLTEKLSGAEGRATEFRESLEQERNKISALRSELAGERTEMHSLREKFAAGETGSDALRQQLKSEEAKVAGLMDGKAEDEGTIQRLKHEIEDLNAQASATAEKQEKLRRHFDKRGERAKQLSERLFHHHDRTIRMLEQFGYSVSRAEDTPALTIQRASKVNASAILSGNEGLHSSSPTSAMRRTISGSTPGAVHYSDPSDLDTLYWTSDNDLSSESLKYTSFLSTLSRLDLDATIDTLTKRYKDVESLAKKYQKDSRAYRERTHRSQAEAHDKIAYRSFKEGDLALFLPTRNQATRPWAAFNVGAPHYFLRETETHKLASRDWLLARITRVEERVVDLSRSIRGNASAAGDDGGSLRSVDDENPFELSDGLRWYMIDAAEEKLGAPGTPSVGKSTVIASVVEVKGHMGASRKEHKSSLGLGSAGAGTGTTSMVTKTLTKSLDSRRSSSGSKKSFEGKGKERGGVNSSSKVGALAPVTSDTDAERRHALPHDARGAAVTHPDDDAHADADNENDDAEAQDSAGSMTAQAASQVQGQAGASVPSIVRRPTEASQTDREEAQVFEVSSQDPGMGSIFPAALPPRVAEGATSAYASLEAARNTSNAPQNSRLQVLGKRPNYATPATSRTASQSPLKQKPQSQSSAATPVASPAKSSTIGSGIGTGSGTSAAASPAKPRERERAWDKLFSMEFRS
ncbi:oligomeric, coiled-coil, peripheral membrane protein [Cladophialophora chaetospira]|uniref:Autophagy-related protein 11 n=1 Tax=Cladophialophora chaetospira TaxID=386627 RepID=A0AA38XB86_9EURO|nr:oligomeric, coiled-coil, peripheral membrane protein [Cladophialophora chaetospira]